ncbi:two-component system response regulator YesN [Paenibacillus phyllosphaerae]|uniref:Two-component system response regulator YesN n=1 Tax=Paenibacillus phyllosphaerae TaxID=274593 RepID=A0A7W5FQS2_9BACL|nr:response regulator [Paenibacillus phyllosphaerae]MBB3113593.1 two-component system response regulator YesN [Paenibacillus phyllosphaerae]
MMQSHSKVLLVDDEQHITRNLEKVIPWEMLGLTVAGTAKNGVEALDYLAQQTADLILCDIRMPVMDGLELVRRIREQGIDLDVIMLSGYQDFTYTRAAIQFGVKDYVLKPIPYDELTGVIARVMSEQRTRRRKAKEEERKIGQMIDLASEKILYDVLMDYTEISPNNLLLAGVEQQLREPQYTVIVLDLDVESESAHDWRDWTVKERKSWNSSLCGVLRHTLQAAGQPHAVIQTRDGEWCVLIQSESGQTHEPELASRWAQQLLGVIKNEKSLKLRAGLFTNRVALTGLSDAYKTVQRGMQLSVSADQLTCYSGELSGAVEPEHVMWETAERLISGLKRGDADDVDAELARLAEQLQQAIGGTTRLRAMLHFVAVHLMRELKEAGLLPREQEESLWRKLDGRFGIKDLFAAIRQATSVGVARSTDKRKHSARQMSEAKSYVDRNLFRDISVEEAASHVGLSTSHFSLLFKQTFGETFIEYVTRQRMEKAKALLVESNWSVSQIAKEVGYAERRYFTKVFMKYTGQNPTEYRSALQEGADHVREPEE